MGTRLVVPQFCQHHRWLEALVGTLYARGGPGVEGHKGLRCHFTPLLADLFFIRASACVQTRMGIKQTFEGRVEGGDAGVGRVSSDGVMTVVVLWWWWCGGVVGS